MTSAEKKLLRLVGNDHLRVSCNQLRAATAAIWASDAPRVIADFTDHGLAHCERVIAHAWELLRANDGRPLTSIEAYVLLAAAYLHDIGMQCDVAAHTGILEAANEAGASLGAVFDAPTSGTYPVAQQNEIRKNHHHLSAAWIDYASRTEKTILAAAAKSIPEDYVDDVIDVVRHHAKLPIADCPAAFVFHPDQRKRFLAALLRFSDELDIDANRVEAHTIETFRLEPRNAVYWWLHSRTKVRFSSRNVVELTVRLHPEDLESCGPAVHDLYIGEFQTKNKPVLSALAQAGLPIVISADSAVVPHTRTKRIPESILRALGEATAGASVAQQLLDEVRTLLRAMGYELSDANRCEDAVEMLASLSKGPVRQRILVRCMDKEISYDDVAAAGRRLDRTTPEAWLIADTRISPSAKMGPGVRVFTLADFQREIWKSYVDSLTALVERYRIPELYVDIGCSRETVGAAELGERDQYTSLDEYVDRWMAERGRSHVSILGEFGAGKTWFCRHYAHRQLERYFADPIGQRFPLLITLREFAKAVTPQQLVNDALLEQYRLPFVGSAYDVFDEINRRGKILLILDGFDEMARQVDIQTVVDNFWQLAQLVHETSKVILTSRTEYFRRSEESSTILGGKVLGRRTLVPKPPRFDVVYLEPLTHDQVRDVILRRVPGPRGALLVDRILTSPNLAEMARKPVVAELLLAALDDIETDAPVSVAQVYLYATNRLLLRNIETRRTFTSTADKLYFLCELAWHMVSSGDLKIHFTALPERIESYFGGRIKDNHELDNWDFDLRNQTLLHRDAAGYYQFAHKSLAEYFVALKFAAELGCLASRFAEHYREGDDLPCALPFKPETVEQLARTFGAELLERGASGGIIGFMSEMLDDNAPGHLVEIARATCGKTGQEVKFVGANAATLACHRTRHLREVDLRGAVLDQADFSGVDLSDADFRGASLRKANFEETILRGTDLRGATLDQLRIADSQLWSVAYDPTRRVLATGGASGIIHCFGLGASNGLTPIVLSRDPIWQVSFCPCGSHLVVLGRGRGTLVTDLSGRPIHEICAVYTEYVSALCWSDQLLYVAGTDGSIAEIEPHAGVVHRREVVSKYPIHGLDIRPDGRELAVACSHGQVLVLDRKRLRVVSELSPERIGLVACVRYSTDGAHLLAGGRKFLCVWRAPGYALESIQRAPDGEDDQWGDGSICRDVRFDRGGLFAAAGYYAGIWQVEPLKRISEFPCHVTAVAASEDGAFFLAGEGAVLRFDLRSGVAKRIRGALIDCTGLKADGATGLDTVLTRVANTPTLGRFFMERGGGGNRSGPPRRGGRSSQRGQARRPPKGGPSGKRAR